MNKVIMFTVGLVVMASLPLPLSVYSGSDTFSVNLLVGSLTNTNYRFITYHDDRIQDVFNRLRVDSGNEDYFVRRNGKGDAIYLIDRQAGEVEKLSCNEGRTRFSIPGFPAWIADDGYIRAWLDTDGSRVHFSTGEQMDPPMNVHYADPSARYFIKPVDAGIEIREMSHPNGVLATLDIRAVGSRIVASDQELLVAGPSDETRNRIRFERYQITNSTLKHVRGWAIDRPGGAAPTAFHVVDISPDMRFAALVDVRDSLFQRWWGDRIYIVNLGTGRVEMHEERGVRGIFLECDIFLKVIS